MTNIPHDILQVIDYVMQYASESMDWLAVKKEILWLCRPIDRKVFTTRHYSTKKHSLNSFEVSVIDYWHSKTGVVLEIPESKLHNPDWKRHQRGWGLKRYNEERRKNADVRKRQQHQPVA